MQNIKFDQFPSITTDRLQLRHVEKSDVNEIFFLRSDKKVMKYIDRSPAKKIGDGYEFIQKITEQEKNNDAVTWAITLKSNSKLIGTICYWNIQKEHFRAEVGYVLHPDYWGKGIMQEALLKVINYGFKVMNLHSIEANVNPGNAASIKLLEKNKFVREAYFKENYFYNGKFLDTVIYSLLNTEHEKEK